LFGPNVEDAIEKYTNPDKDLYGLLRLFGTTETIISRFNITDTHAIGYDRADRELVRVALEEPMYVRPEYDERYDVTRINEP
jgi:nitrate reductase beta subunit